MLEFNLSVSENKFNQLQSKDLKKNLNKMLQTMSGVNKNQWQYAIALHNIVSNEYYKPDFKTVPDFADAVAAARQLAKPGGAVLLSPACASFDAFKNFAERGETFKKIVRGYEPCGHNDTEN